MNLFKLLFKNNPKKYIIQNLVEIKSQEPNRRLQEIRKRNFQRAIIQYFNGDIIEFSNYYVCHKDVIYCYLLHSEHKSAKNIDTRFARLYELYLHLKPGIFDEENDLSFDNNYIPFFDSEKFEIMERESIKYINPKYHTSQLFFLDTSTLSQISFFDGDKYNTYHKDLLGYIAVINKNSNKEISFISRNGYRKTFTGELIDRLMS